MLDLVVFPLIKVCKQLTDMCVPEHACTLDWRRLLRVRIPKRWRFLLLPPALRGCFTWKRGALNRVPLIAVLLLLSSFYQRFPSGRFVRTQTMFFFQLLFLVKCLVLLQRFLLRFDLHPFYKNTHTSQDTPFVLPPTPTPTPLSRWVVLSFPPALQTCPVATMPLAASASGRDSAAALLTRGG